MGVKWGLRDATKWRLKKLEPGGFWCTGQFLHSVPLFSLVPYSQLLDSSYCIWQVFVQFYWTFGFAFVPFVFANFGTPFKLRAVWCFAWNWGLLNRVTSEKISYDEIRYIVFSLQPYVMHVLESLWWVVSQGLTHGDTLSIADGLMALYCVPNLDNP